MNARIQEPTSSALPRTPCSPSSVLRELEWSARYSYCTGWPCCPICKGIKPGHGADEAGRLPLNQGHKKDCRLKLSLENVQSVPPADEKTSTKPQDV